MPAKKKKTAKKTPRPIGRSTTERLTLGRPTKYKPEYCQQIIEFFDQPMIDAKTEEAHDPIYLSAFARNIGVVHDTLIEWTSRYPAFSEAYSEAKQLQKEMIITNAMQGRYNPSFAWRMMMNCHNWRDKQDHTVDVKPLVVFDDEESKKAKI